MAFRIIKHWYKRKAFTSKRRKKKKRRQATQNRNEKRKIFILFWAQIAVKNVNASNINAKCFDFAFFALPFSLFFSFHFTHFELNQLCVEKCYFCSNQLCDRWKFSYQQYFFKVYWNCFLLFAFFLVNST